MMTTLETLVINSDRLRSDFEELASIGATETGGVTRLALSHSDLQARAWFADRIQEAGLLIRDDAVGNLGAFLPCRYEGAKTLIIGSHLDTVANGGRYDGVVGVLAGLECLRTLQETHTDLPFHVEVVNFTDEEGNWQSFFGSLGFTGNLLHLRPNNEQDIAAFRAALSRAGIDVQEINKARRDPDSLLGYLELHIEQGSRLCTSGVPLGIVTTIVGRTMYQLTFNGEAVHAATNAHKRRDALQGAAEFITRVHALVADRYSGGVVNCANVTVEPGAFSMVPSRVVLQFECRHPDERLLAKMEGEILELAQDCTHKQNLTLETRLILHRTAATMDSHLMQTIERVCQSAGHSYLHMVSYAGHDAQILSNITPSAMIFIPSVDGISHNPKEYTEWDDIERGANILLQTILNLADQLT